MEGCIEFPGILYDSILLLSFACGSEPCFDMLISKENAAFVQRLKAGIGNEIAALPPYLHPFFAEYEKSSSFVQSTLFELQPYNQMDRMHLVLNNTQYLKRQLVEYFYPERKQDTVNKIMSLTFPDAFEILAKPSKPHPFTTLLVLVLTRFESVLKSVVQTIDATCRYMTEIHRSIIPPGPGPFENMPSQTWAKLKVLSGTSKTVSLQFSLTLIEDHRIAYHPVEPYFFLLGERFGERIESCFKYEDVSPLAFAAALGNAAKCIIFEALLKYAPMSAAEMEAACVMGKSTLLSKSAQRISQQ